MEGFMMYGRIHDVGIEYYPPRDALALQPPGEDLSMSHWSWGFHTVRRGVNPGNRWFFPRLVGVVNVWKYYDVGM